MISDKKHSYKGQNAPYWGKRRKKGNNETHHYM